MSDHNASPFNTIPPVTAALCLVMALVEIAFSLGARGLLGGPGAVGWRLTYLEQFAVSGQVLDFMLQTGRWPPELLVRFLAYPFVHAAFTQALIAIVMLLALGKMVAESLGPLRMLAIYTTTTVLAAVFYCLVVPDAPALYGAFPPVYGLIGAFTYLLWVKLGAMGEAQVRAFALIGVLMGLQLIFGLLFDGGPYWVAELAGFAVGFTLTALLVPGSFGALLERLRRR